MAKIYTVDGFTGTKPEIAKHFGLVYQTLVNRLEKGIPLEEAIFNQRKVESYTVGGFTGTKPEIAKHFGIKYPKIISRLNRG